MILPGRTLCGLHTRPWDPEAGRVCFVGFLNPQENGFGFADGPFEDPLEAIAAIRKTGSLRPSLLGSPERSIGVLVPVGKDNRRYSCLHVGTLASFDEGKYADWAQLCEAQTRFEIMSTYFLHGDFSEVEPLGPPDGSAEHTLFELVYVDVPELCGTHSG